MRDYATISEMRSDLLSAEWTEAALLTTMLGLSDALQRTLDKLASEHGGRDGEWISKLRADCLRAAKNIEISNTIPDDIQLRCLDLTLHVIGDSFDKVEIDLLPRDLPRLPPPEPEA